MKEKLQDQRIDYTIGALDIDKVDSDPLKQFLRWYADYEGSKPKDPNAFTLATASKDGQPHSRILLLKGVDQGGFEFYTNYKSDKGKELAQNPKASMCFFWPELERQIRMEGVVEKLSEAESTAYFNSRPHGSQVGAWVSPQSQVISSRSILEESANIYSEKYPNQVPKPEHWGGYRLMPQRIEFWQGRASRLHDRVLYTQKAGGQWDLHRLAP